jgi:hypothetical protein
MLALAITVTQIGAVAAQDTTTTTPLTGTVQTITVETDSTTSVSTVVVTYKDDTGTIQTVRLSVETATSLGLVTTNSTTGTPVVVVNDSAKGQPVTIDPSTVVTDPPDETDETTEAEHPVGLKLTDFFGDILGVDYDTIMIAHEDGAGFGVIAQALWMTNKLGGDASTFQAIIEAKKTGDYSSLTLPDGSTSTATNWGQFKKDVTDKGNKDNLGSVMSGKANNDQTQDDITTLGDAQRGNGRDQNDNGKGNQDKGDKPDKGDKGDKGDNGNGGDKGGKGDKGKGKP